MVALTSEIDTTPSESLLDVDVGFYIGMPKSWSKKKRKLKNGQYCDNNADLDNYEKAIFDSLNKVLYVDDRQIVEISSRKIYSDEPCIIFNMKTAGDSTNDKGGIM